MNQNQNRATARLSKNGKYLLVEHEGKTAILNANLIRYLFDVPYTRKDGKRINTQEIFRMKQEAQAAYEEKVKRSAG